MIKDIEEFKKNPSIVFEYTYLTQKPESYYNPEKVKRDTQQSVRKISLFGGRSADKEEKTAEKESRKVKIEKEEPVK